MASVVTVRLELGSCFLPVVRGLCSTPVVLVGLLGALQAFTAAVTGVGPHVLGWVVLLYAAAMRRPSYRTFFAAFQSRSWKAPHSPQVQNRTFSGLGPSL